MASDIIERWKAWAW